jgi:hypothetical protein
MDNKIEQIKENILQSITAISQAKNKRSEIKSKADHDYYNETSWHKENLRSITKRYEDIAAQLAEEQNIAPYSRSGSHLEHDDAKVDHKGIHLSWEADDHWNCVYHTFTWEEIFEAEQKQLDNEGA